MSSFSSTYPAIRPTYQIDFSNGKRIPPNATFSRSDSPIDASKAAASAVHYWSNEKHESSQNLVEYSSDISNGYWTKQGVSPTGGQTAPDGGTDAYKLTEDAATSDHRIYHLFGATPTDATTITFFAKYIGRQWIYVRAKDSGGTNRYCWLDIQNGVVGTVQTNVTASIAASGNGYYKCTVVLASAIASGQSLNIGGAAADGDGGGYAGLNGDAFAVWGIQASTTGETVLNETNGQIHRSYAPTLKSVATAGQPRFEYDPAADGQSIAKGILIEGASTNLVNYSNNFSQWGATNVAAEAAAAVGPDGQLCHVMREDTSAGVNHRLTLPVSGQSNSTTYTMSVYAKKVASSNQTRHLRLRVNGLGGEASVEYDLGSGTVNRTYGSSLNSQSISSIGNGWYRLVMTYTNGSGSVSSGMIITGSPDTAATLPDYDGDGFTSFALFGAMVEEGSHASSLVTSNSGSQTTRAAESLSVATADIGYTGGPVSIVAESDGGRGDYPRLFSMGDSSSYLSFFRYSSAASASTAYKFWVYDSGTKQADLNEEASVTRVAVSVDTNSVKSCGNGGTVQSDTAAVMPVLSGLQIGDQPTGGKQWNGHIKRVALYNEALSDTNLQALTS